MWSNWALFSTCSQSCGGGIRTRERFCLNGAIGEPGCDVGASTETNLCQTQACPYWSEWSSLSACSVTCGPGYAKRTRTCVGGSAGVAGCEGDREETVECPDQKPCPFWEQWSEFSPCPVTCGRGRRTRSRFCSEDRGCGGSSVEVDSITCIRGVSIFALL